jgi:hypothetical protein
MLADSLATTYLKQYRTGASEDFWAFEAILEACGNLATGLPVVLELIELAVDDSELSYVAAGPVEDLLKWHGKAAIAAFEKAAVHSTKVRQALAGVWINADDDAFSDWKRLMEEYFPGAFN